MEGFPPLVDLELVTPLSSRQRLTCLATVCFNETLVICTSVKHDTSVYADVLSRCVTLYHTNLWVNVVLVDRRFA